MTSIESIYQSKLEKFYSAAETHAVKLGPGPGAFSGILNAIEERMALEPLYAAAAPAQPAQPSGHKISSKEVIDSAVENAAGKTGLDADLIRAVIQVESSFRIRAESGCGAQGLMQLMPGTAKEMGVKDPFNAQDNVMGGAGYLKKLLHRFGDIRLALAAYNTGQGRIASLHIKDPDDPEQYARISSGVRGYVNKVLKYWEKFKKS